MEACKQAAANVFAARDSDSRKSALAHYDAAAEEFESGLVQSLRNALLLRNDDYVRIRNTIADQSALAKILTGYHTGDDVQLVMENLGKALGTDSTMIMRLHDLVGSMDPDERLITWNVGEEKANEMLAIIVPST